MTILLPFTSNVAENKHIAKPLARCNISRSLLHLMFDFVGFLIGYGLRFFFVFFSFPFFLSFHSDKGASACKDTYLSLR